MNEKTFKQITYSIILLFALFLSFCVGGNYGANFQREKWQRRLINNKLGEEFINSKGEKDFRIFVEENKPLNQGLAEVYK